MLKYRSFMSFFFSNTSILFKTMFVWTKYEDFALQKTKKQRRKTKRKTWNSTSCYHRLGNVAYWVKSGMLPMRFINQKESYEVTFQNLYTKYKKKKNNRMFFFNLPFFLLHLSIYPSLLKWRHLSNFPPNLYFFFFLLRAGFRC